MKLGYADGINSPYRIIQEKNADDFLKNNSDLLYEHEAEYGLLLGLPEARLHLEKPDDYIYLSVFQNKKRIGAVCLTEINTIVSAMDEDALKTVAHFIHEKNFKVPGVVAPAQTSETFAQLYSKISGKKFKLGMDQKLYQLEKVIWPDSVDGKLINADLSHLQTAAQWLFEFYQESLPHESLSLERARLSMETRINKKEVFIWLNKAGEPVAINLSSRPTRNGISISFVYTPPNHRKKGYASALVAHTSQKMLDAGKKFCVLYTDVTNPTSNRIYQNIGYQEIAKSKQYLFF